MASPYPAHAKTPPYPTWLYCAVHTGNSVDLDFYLRACDGAESVLELGCGTGRIAAAIAATGSEVVGIDRDADALKMADGRGFRTVFGNMRDLNFECKFDRIIAPYNALYCLLTEDDFVACLRGAAQCLADDGHLVFDVYCADVFHAALDFQNLSPDEAILDGSDEDSVMRVDAGGRAWDVFEQSLWWPHEQRIDATFRHVACDDGETIEAMIPQRYVLSGQLAYLLGEAGLMLRGLAGDLDGSPFEPDSELMVVHASVS